MEQRSAWPPSSGQATQQPLSPSQAGLHSLQPCQPSLKLPGGLLCEVGGPAGSDRTVTSLAPGGRLPERAAGLLNTLWPSECVCASACVCVPGMSVCELLCERVGSCGHGLEGGLVCAWLCRRGGVAGGRYPHKQLAVHVACFALICGCVLTRKRWGQASQALGVWGCGPPGETLTLFRQARS